MMLFVLIVIILIVLKIRALNLQAFILFALLGVYSIVSEHQYNIAEMFLYLTLPLMALIVGHMDGKIRTRSAKICGIAWIVFLVVVFINTL